MLQEKHILSIKTSNTPGVLSRISGLLRRKLFNIDSLTVGRTHDPKISRFTIVITGSNKKALKAASVIERLIEIRSVKVLEMPETFKREIILARVKLKLFKQLEDLKPPCMLISQIDQKENIFVFEMVDKSDNLEHFLETLNSNNIEVLDWVRSGIIALER